MTLQVPSRRSIVGAVLAGGKSRRMGRDKAGVVCDDATGETFGARAVGALRAVADEVVVLGHGRGLDVALERIPDPLPDAGPVAGLVALLEARPADFYVVGAVDMPGIGADDFASLLAALAAAQGPCAAVFLRDESKAMREPLPLALTRQAITPVRAAFDRGERRLGRVIDGLCPLAVRSLDQSHLENVNTFEDLQRWSGSARRR